MRNSKIEVNFINPFIEGAQNTIRVQCLLEATYDKPFIKGTREQPEFDIAGVIGITSECFTGTITICFTRSVYLRLMSNMLGEEFTEISKDLRDGAAELMNIIFGSAKGVLTKQGHSLQRAIPTVICGKGLVTNHLWLGVALVLPFSTAHGEFHIEILTEKSKAR